MENLLFFQGRGRPKRTFKPANFNCLFYLRFYFYVLMLRAGLKLFQRKREVVKSTIPAR